MNDPGAIALIDQLSAEESEAERLVPFGQNRRLASLPRARFAIMHALGSAELEGIEGAVPIVRLNPARHADVASAHARTDTTPVGSAVVCRYCNLCSDPTGWTVPFWVNCGSVIAQIDLCNGCARHAIDALDAQPQLGLSVG